MLCVQVALYSNVRCLDNTTPHERHIAGMAGIAHGIVSQKPAPITFALKFIQAYQADPGCAQCWPSYLLALPVIDLAPLHNSSPDCSFPLFTCKHITMAVSTLMLGVLLSYSSQ